MLTLQSPMEKLPVKERLRRTMTGEIPPPSDAAPEDRSVPGALEAVCMKAMAFRPEERYARSGSCARTSSPF